MSLWDNVANGMTFNDTGNDHTNENNKTELLQALILLSTRLKAPSQVLLPTVDTAHITNSQ